MLLQNHCLLLPTSGASRIGLSYFLLFKNIFHFPDSSRIVNLDSCRTLRALSLRESLEFLLLFFSEFLQFQQVVVLVGLKPQTLFLRQQFGSQVSPLVSSRVAVTVLCGEHGSGSARDVGRQSWEYRLRFFPFLVDMVSQVGFLTPKPERQHFRPMNPQLKAVKL